MMMTINNDDNDTTIMIDDDDDGYDNNDTTIIYKEGGAYYFIFDNQQRKEGGVGCGGYWFFYAVGGYPQIQFKIRSSQNHLRGLTARASREGFIRDDTIVCRPTPTTATSFVHCSSPTTRLIRSYSSSSPLDS